MNILQILQQQPYWRNKYRQELLSRCYDIDLYEVHWNDKEIRLMSAIDNQRVLEKIRKEALAEIEKQYIQERNDKS